MHIVRVGERLPRLQIQFRISRSFRPRNLANLRSKIPFSDSPKGTHPSPPITKARETEFSSYCNRHISTTSGSKSSPWKSYYRNSSGARRPTSNSAWTTKEKTSTGNREAEGASLSGPFSLSRAKATPTTRDRGTGDWNQRHYDRFTLSKNPDFFVCRFPRQYIDQSLQSFSPAAVLRPEE